MRKLLLIVVIAACAKSASRDEGAKSSEPAAGGAPPPPPAEQAAPVAAPAPTPTPTQGSAARDEARAHGVLGPTDQDLFKPLEQDKEKRDRKGTGAAPGDGAPAEGGLIGTVAAEYVAKIEKGPIAPTKDAIQACYNKVRTKHPQLVGEISLKFKYNADGTTADVAIDKSTVKNAELEACVVDVVKNAKLPTAKGTGRTTARISFKLVN